MSAKALQSFLRASVRARSTTANAGAFDLFLNPTDPLPNFNYAIPNRPVERAEALNALPALEALFGEHARLPRFEYVDGFAPELAGALEASGYVSEPPALAMLCGPSDLFAGEMPQGSTIEIASEATDDVTFANTLALRARAFAAPDRSTLPDEIAQARASLVHLTMAIARVEGKVAGAASLTDAYGDVAEIAGVAVDPAYRRRGIAGLLTARLAALAFERGATSVFLTAGLGTAAGVYSRIGFSPAPYRVLEYRKAS